MPGQLTVSTRSGSVLGELASPDIRVWRGIPFAAPPVGRLRLRAPEPVVPWIGVRDARAFGPVCTQPEGGRAGGLPKGTVTSEDCLYLNVWSPTGGRADKPVLVWIHGGALITGGGSLPNCDGARLAAEGDAVIVTLNYRLGPLGQMDFGTLLSHSAFERNLGLKDQIAALTWIKDNIAGFGGDTGRITLFGESAGANSITTLYAIPAARGLFAAAIAQSSHAATAHSIDRKVEHADRLMRMLGLSTVDDLISAPAQHLADAGSELEDSVAREEPGVLVMSPAVDGDLLPDYPLATFRAGLANPAPLVLGTTKDEANGFRLFKLPIMPTTPSALTRMLSQTDPAAMRRICESYPGFPDDKSAVLEMATDGIFRGPALEIAEARSTHGHATWMYRFDCDTPLLRAFRLGATHSIDIPYVFGNFSAGSARVYTALSRRRMLDAAHTRISAHWLAFADTTDPSVSGTAWPRYAQDRATMILGNRSSDVVLDPQPTGREAWMGVGRHS